MAESIDSSVARWLPTVVDLHSRLHDDPPARIADIGCGDGRSTIALARLYPKVRIDGFDLDEAIIDQAWHNAHTCGLTDRITFHVRDVSEPMLNGRYELCIAYQGLHNMHNLSGVLRTMHRLAGADGAVIVVEQGPGQRMAEQVQPANAVVSTAMAFDTLARKAHVAGFTHVEQLSFAHLAFYRLYI